ncbi:MAG: XTP/dITP diphosphatase [bacterium]
MDLTIATYNRHKVREIAQILSDFPLRITSLSDLPRRIAIEETGATFAENAAHKALTVASLVEGIVLADDSGLEVDALGGEPGVFSARYAGPRATDLQNNKKLLAALEGVPWERRGARFRCVVALVDAQRQVHYAEGTCEGIIAFEPVGEHGFGYDPLFFLPEYTMTMAQVSPAVKNRISHRAQAINRARDILDRLLPIGGVDFSPPSTI